MCSKNVPDRDPKDPPRTACAGARLSLGAKLTLWYALSALLLTATASGLLYWAMARSLDQENDASLSGEIEEVARLLAERDPDAPELKWEVEQEYAPQHMSQVSIRLLDHRGRVLLSTPGMEDRLPASLFPPPGPLPRAGITVRSSAGRPFRLVAGQAAAGRVRDEPLVIQAALDIRFHEHLLRTFRHRLLIVSGIIFGASAIAGHLIARRGLRPLADIARTARRIHSATLHERMTTAGLPPEVLALAATFNQMLDRLQESFTRISRFSADIAHELRTPVHALRCEMEVALGKARTPEEYHDILSSCLEECAHMSRLIDSLLFLARADHAELRLRREPLDVERELAAVLEFYDAAALDAGVQIERRLEAGVCAEADRPLFQRAVGNLVENAIAHTPRGGIITVTAEKADGAVRIEVSDSGEGIPAEHLPRIFDRFYRADPSRPKNGGAGLGLAIVRSIVLLHGGSATASNSPAGGARVTLTFPARACADAAART